LKDKSVIPDDNLVFGIIGDKSALWQDLMKQMHLKYPDIQELWNYYNDGKNWLFRMMRKKKTIFWIGILPDTFRITFYFGDKAESLIESSDLPASMKADFKNGKRYGKIRAISIEVAGAEDIENARKVADIKIKA